MNDDYRYGVIHGLTLAQRIVDTVAESDGGWLDALFLLDKWKEVYDPASGVEDTND